MTMNLFRQKLSALAALALLAGLFWLARYPTLAEAEAGLLAERFGFTRVTLADLPAHPHKQVRQVHPSLERISAWISSVGAAVALADLDADGLANDVCQIDPRTDLAIISPAPGTGERYAAFALDPAVAGYDAATMAPMGCLSGDFNEDGKRDLLVYYWGRTPIAFLRRGEAMAAASYLAMDVKPGGERWFTNAATLADIDGDGHVDLIVGNYFQDGGRILDAKATGVESMHGTMSKSFNGGSKHFLLWDGGAGGETPVARFREVDHILPDEVDHGWVLAVGAADLDGDGLPELYFAHDFGPDRLLSNRSTPGRLAFVELRGERGFTTPKSAVLGQDSFKGMGADFGDVNGDGMLDIYVSNIASRYALQESHMLWLSSGDVSALRQGRAPYVQASERLGLSRSGWGWDAKLADMDNDGVPEALQATGFVKGTINRWPELQSLGTGNDQLISDPRHWPKFRPGDDLSGQQPNAFFARAGDGRYHNIARHLGLDEPMVSRGIAIADVDGDGDLDFAVANQWAPSFLYRNDCPRCGAFLGLRLMRVGAGRQVRELSGQRQADGYPAIGAQAVVRLPDGRRLVAQVDGGNGHSGKRGQELHFGLGANREAVEVEISWRDTRGRMQRTILKMNPGWHTVLLGQA